MPMCMRVGKEVYCFNHKEYAKLYKQYGVKLAEKPEVWKANGTLIEEYKDER